MDYSDEHLPDGEPPKHPRKLRWLNFFSGVFFTGTVVFVSYAAAIFSNPTAGYNPFPPHPTAQPPVIPTSTATLIPTSTNTPQPTAIATPVFTSTPAASPTETSTPTTAYTPFMILLPTQTPGAAETQAPVDSEYPFVVMQGSPATLPYSAMVPNVGCAWLGVGGNVEDQTGAPILGLRVQVYGSFHGYVKAEMSITGTVQRYGGAGYEIQIDDIPSYSYQTLWVQLYNQAGTAVSEKVFITTSDQCDQNLTLINFKQVR